MRNFIKNSFQVGTTIVGKNYSHDIAIYDAPTMKAKKILMCMVTNLKRFPTSKAIDLNNSVVLRFVKGSLCLRL